MKLSRVWNYFTPEVKQAFAALGQEDERVRTKALLGALADTAEPEVVQQLQALESELEDGLIHPDLPPASDPECPEQLTFSPCVKEVLNFYRIHELKPVSAAEITLRLLQIGTGSTVRELEKTGDLPRYQQAFSELTVL